jgi:ABC-type Mn2+/Zn2+ transport system ATPase subunit
VNGHPIIRFEGVRLGYGRKVVLNDVHFQIHNGEFFGVVGPNGAGKTTLLRAILGTLKPQAGVIGCANPDGTPVRWGYVPQRDAIDSVLPFTARDVVMMGRYHHVGAVRLPGKPDEDIVMRSMEHVGIQDLVGRIFRDLSGGQKQRVLIARALATGPDVLVLDEPANGMDLASRFAMLDLIDRLHEQDRLTVIMVSHQLDDVANLAQQIALVERDFFQVGGVNDVLTNANLTTLYGVPMHVDSISGRTVVTVGGRDERR